ncbi:hypothetical protein U1Q18_051042 [Sarracenia purpurea var. burkii]
MSSISHGIPYSPSPAPYSRSVVFLLGFLYSVNSIHQKNNIHAENELAIPAKLPTRRSKETVTNAAKLKVESGHLSQSSKHPLEWECCDTARWGWLGWVFGKNDGVFSIICGKFAGRRAHGKKQLGMTTANAKRGGGKPFWDCLFAAGCSTVVYECRVYETTMEY